MQNTATDRKRVWLRSEQPTAAWWPWGWLPLLGAGATFLYGLLVITPAIEAKTAEQVQTASLAVNAASSAPPMADIDEPPPVVTPLVVTPPVVAQDMPDTDESNLVIDVPILDSAPIDPVEAAPAGAAATQIDATAGCNEQFATALAASSIRFEKTSAEISPESQSLVEQLAAIARECPFNLSVSGHTDYIGRTQYNNDLSLARAEAIVAAFIAQGIETDRLTAQGLGASRPVADNTTEAGRALNRRIEIQVVPRSQR